MKGYDVLRAAAPTQEELDHAWQQVFPTKGRKGSQEEPEQQATEQPAGEAPEQPVAEPSPEAEPVESTAGAVVAGSAAAVAAAGAAGAVAATAADAETGTSDAAEPTGDAPSEATEAADAPVVEADDTAKAPEPEMKEAAETTAAAEAAENPAAEVGDTSAADTPAAEAAEAADTPAVEADDAAKAPETEAKEVAAAPVAAAAAAAGAAAVATTAAAPEAKDASAAGSPTAEPSEKGSPAPSGSTPQEDPATPTPTRRWKAPLAAAAALLICVAGGFAGAHLLSKDKPANDGKPGQSAPPAEKSGLYVGSGTVLQQDGKEPQLCHSVVATRPPQCGGLKLAGWEWGKTPSSHEQGVRWSEQEVYLVGTYDGNTFTVKRPPLSREEARAGVSKELLKKTEGAFEPKVACPVPEGGWKVQNDKKISEDDLFAVSSEVAKWPNHGSLWVVNTEKPGPATDGNAPTVPVGSRVVNVTVTDDPAEAEKRIRQWWGGPLCVTQTKVNHARFAEIRTELEKELDLSSGGENVLTSGNTLTRANAPSSGNSAELIDEVLPAPEAPAPAKPSESAPSQGTPSTATPSTGAPSKGTSTPAPVQKSSPRAHQLADGAGFIAVGVDIDREGALQRTYDQKYGAGVVRVIPWLLPFTESAR